MLFSGTHSFKRQTLASLITVALSLPAMANTTQVFEQVPRVDNYLLSQGIVDIGSLFNVVIVAPEDLIKGIKVAPLNGEYTLNQALQALTQNTGLVVEQTAQGAFLLKKQHAAITADGAALSTSEAKIERLEVYTERLANDLNSLARSVSIIGRDALDVQFSAAANIAEVLAKVVPGMAPPTPALTNFGTTMRGRNALVLIDGVPMNTNRNISRDLHNLHPSQVARIEVFRGGNSLYGSGASGGVIYIYTKSGQQQSAAQTIVTAKSSLKELGGDALSYSAAHSYSGEHNDWLYRIGASYEVINGLYDAEGDRLAPEPSQGDNFDSDIVSFDFKVDKSWDTHALSFSVMNYALKQNSAYASDPSVNTLPYITKAQGLKGLELDKQTEINNLVVNVKYHNQFADQHKLSTQLYYRDYDSRFSPFDARHIPSWNHIAQTYLESSNLGLRLTIQSELTTDLHLEYGLDAQDERSESPVTTYDGETYDRSRHLHFVETGDKTFVPELSHRTVAAFMQARASVTDKIGIEGGLRYEQIDASFDSFNTLGQHTPIKGSSFDYDSTFYNLGLSYDIVEGHTVYLASNEGYELPDIGFQIRSASSQFDLSKSKLEPIATTDYEVGYRGHLGSVSFDLAYYQSESDLGWVTSDGIGLALRRDQIEIDGFELSASIAFSDTVFADLSYTQVNGDEKRQGQDIYSPMNGFSTPPDKLVASLHADVFDNWRTRFTAMHIKDEDFRIDGQNGWGRRDVKGYSVVDWVNSIDLFDGQLILGIENLFNKNYFPLYSQLQRNGRNSSSVPGRGRTVSIRYQLDW